MDDPSTTAITEGFGLMYYGARMYDPALGRFTSADTIVPGGVQGYDRYAYVNNSPLNFVDPSGHEPKYGCYQSSGNTCLNANNTTIVAGRGKSTSWIDPVNPMTRGGGYDYDKKHPGIDLNPDSAENSNPEILASSYGTVYSSTACSSDPCVGHNYTENNGYGNVVIIGYDYVSLPPEIKALIPDGATLFMLYAHLEEPSSLSEGDAVVPGQLIGNVGTTGASDAVHLHMEIRVESGRGSLLPVGPMHINGGPETGYTNVHTIWHTRSWMVPQNPHNFFNIR